MDLNRAHALQTQYKHGWKKGSQTVNTKQTWMLKGTPGKDTSRPEEVKYMSHTLPTDSLHSEGVSSSLKAAHLILQFPSKKHPTPHPCNSPPPLPPPQPHVIALLPHPPPPKKSCEVTSKPPPHRSRSHTNLYSFIILQLLKDICVQTKQNTHLSVVNSEGAQVGHHPGWQQHVAQDVDVPLTQHAGCLRPAVLLSSQATNQLLCAVQLLGAQVDVVLQVLLLLRHHLKLVVQGLQLVRHLVTGGKGEVS